jgi:hypothetical protein
MAMERSHVLEALEIIPLFGAISMLPAVAAGSLLLEADRGVVCRETLHLPSDPPGSGLTKRNRAPSDSSLPPAQPRHGRT